MILQECLSSLCGYGIHLLNRDGRLVIQSATDQLTPAQTDVLTAHKPLLLALLPEGSRYTPGAVLEAVEAYDERTAIMIEAGAPDDLIVTTATTQARAVLLRLSSPSPYPHRQIGTAASKVQQAQAA